MTVSLRQVMLLSYSWLSLNRHRIILRFCETAHLGQHFALSKN